MDIRYWRLFISWVVMWKECGLHLRPDPTQLFYRSRRNTPTFFFNAW
jgi:hypothetical protein